MRKLNFLIYCQDASRSEFLISSLEEFFGRDIHTFVMNSFPSLGDKHVQDADLVITEAELDGKSVVPYLKESALKSPVIFMGESQIPLHEIFDLFTLDLVSDLYNTQQLQRAFEKARVILDKSFPHSEIRTYKKRFLVKIGNRWTLIPVENIACFIAEGGITFLMESGSNQKYLVDHTLNELESRFLNPEEFYRINRSIIVNLENLIEMKPFQNGRLVLSLKAKTEDSLIVAREKVNHFKAWLDR